MPSVDKTGATKADSWIDIEGGVSAIIRNASLRRKFPDLPYCTDGEPIILSKGGQFMGHHYPGTDGRSSDPY